MIGKFLPFTVGFFYGALSGMFLIGSLFTRLGGSTLGNFIYLLIGPALIIQMLPINFPPHPINLFLLPGIFMGIIFELIRRLYLMTKS